MPMKVKNAMKKKNANAMKKTNANAMKIVNVMKKEKSAKKVMKANAPKKPSQMVMKARRVIKKPGAKVMTANASVMKKPAKKAMKANAPVIKKPDVKIADKKGNTMIPNQEGQWLHINTKHVPEVWVQCTESQKANDKHVTLKSIVMQGTVTGRG